MKFIEHDTWIDFQKIFFLILITLNIIYSAFPRYIIEHYNVPI